MSQVPRPEPDATGAPSEGSSVAGSPAAGGLASAAKPAEAKKPRRWRPRFSLRTLTLCVLLFAAAYGLWLHRDAWVLERHLAFGPEFPADEGEPAGFEFRLRQWEVAEFSADRKRLLAGKQHWERDQAGAMGFSIQYAEEAATAVIDLDGGRILIQSPYLEAWHISPHGQWVYNYPSAFGGGSMMHVDTGKAISMNRGEPKNGSYEQRYIADSIQTPSSGTLGNGVIAHLKDERRGVYTERDEALVLCDLLTDETLLRMTKTPKGWSNSGRFSPLDRYLITEDGTLWDLRTGTIAMRHTGERERFGDFAPDESKVLVTEWNDPPEGDAARLLELPSAKMLAEWENVDRAGPFSDDGRLLLLCTKLKLTEGQQVAPALDKQTVTVMDTNSLQPLAAFPVRGYEVRFAPHSELVLVTDMTGDRDDPYDMDVHDARTGALLSTLQRGPDEGIGQGRTLRADEGDDWGAGADIVYVTDLATGERLAALQGPPSRIRDSRWPVKICAAAFTEGDAGAWIARSDRTVQYWERRRDESEWGILTLPECWLTALFALLLLWSLVRDFKTLRKLKAPA